MRKHKKLIYLIFAVFVLAIVSRGIVEGLKISPFIFQLLFNQEINLKKSDDHINILLLGIGGAGHEGPNLTDTIIFASLDQAKNKATLVSIPRDLWIADLDGKINTAYAIGEAKRKGGGLILAKKVVSKILNQEINYGATINFNGFVKAVDMLGGLDINIEKTLDDYEYPIDGKENDVCGHTDEEIQALATASSQLLAFPCRYTEIHFDKGPAHMSGIQALEFVRSRHAQGEEGSDFARSKRQELVIKAFKDKVLSLETLINPGRLVGLYEILKNSIDTDIKQDEFDDFIRLAQKLKGVNFQSSVLDYGDEKTGRAGLLVNPPASKNFNNEWVLIPRLGSNNFSEIQKYVNCEIKIGSCIIPQKPTL